MATETDAEVYARLTADPTIRRLIETLDWENRQGDATTRKRAVSDLRDHATLREIAAVKRWIKR